ncbi:protein-glutamine gamma-glutamyltransferase [Ectobacillus ponti]|uniref:Protein-glutamine gamma-glutamyltransferase n=1 Tax=Ectobacillus ponti TaxID=2961894 RepID=A0AA42BRD6_9BACI|nr:protein-glutamine gamma-glutamyltransferase [Ectobacillus ponti]MCP8970301.1 protein-glutamine gamma-glutamyltransferase [Ectobacillus ponti]
MIVIGRSVVHPYLANEAEPFFETKQQILTSLAGSQEVHTYESIDQLSFDLNVRLQLLLACISLFSGGMQFRTFETSICNEAYWTRAKNGGFQLKKDMLPSFAIRDIFNNGSKYGTECATAMIIIMYKALLELYNEDTFNRMFAGLLLYTWDYDKDLRLVIRTDADIVQGDLAYFKNPHVNPDMMHWQGENTIYLGDGMYYGHGVGVRTYDQIIFHLNERRFPGAFLSAYLTDMLTRIDVRAMSRFADKNKIATNIQLIPIRENIVMATVGSTTTIH